MPQAAPTEAQLNRVRLVGAMGVGQILAWSSTYYLPAVLASPISQTTGWSITHVVMGLSLGLLVAGACSPKIGRMIDRYGGRSILAASSLLMALGLALMGAAQHLAVYYLAWTIIGFAMAAGLYDAAFATLGRLLGSTARSSISGLTLLGGFASTVGWPLLAYLEHELGWRGACFVMAGAHLLIGVPIYLSFVPRTQTAPATATGSTAINVGNLQPSTYRQLFLLLALLLTLQSLVTSSVSVHLLDVLKLLGIAATTVLAIGMVIGPAQVAGRIAEFTWGQGLHPTWATRLGVLLCLIGIVLLLPAQPWLAFMAIALYGAGNGILTITRGTLPLVLFGPAGYGIRMGLLARPMLVAQAVGPIGAAMILDAFSAETLLALLAGIAFVGLLSCWRLPSK
ncbi:MFS transporter [Pseudomonas sp. AA-38]|uniref:MFS transporter n=1 Tax=Pseudomonas sp. AA-38 TaxID=3028807 RepID=UPI0023F86DAA|nr:MFS transporter [Pseudomonas sp. AA-38]